jgi:hypothetical protein
MAGNRPAPMACELKPHCPSVSCFSMVRMGYELKPQCPSQQTCLWNQQITNTAGGEPNVSFESFIRMAPSRRNEATNDPFPCVR